MAKTIRKMAKKIFKQSKKKGPQSSTIVNTRPTRSQPPVDYRVGSKTKVNFESEIEKKEALLAEEKEKLNDKVGDPGYQAQKARVLRLSKVLIESKKKLGKITAKKSSLEFDKAINTLNAWESSEMDRSRVGKRKKVAATNSRDAKKERIKAGIAVLEATNRAKKKSKKRRPESEQQGFEFKEKDAAEDNEIEFAGTQSNDEVLKDRLQTAIDKGLLINVEDGSEDEAKANPTFEFNAKSEAEARAKVKTEAEVRLMAEARVKVEAEARAKAEAEARARAEVILKFEAESKVRAEAEARAEAQAKADAQAKAETYAKADVMVKAETYAKAQAKAEARAKVEARTEPVPFKLNYGEINRDAVQAMEDNAMLESANAEVKASAEDLAMAEANEAEANEAAAIAEADAELAAAKAEEAAAKALDDLPPPYTESTESKTEDEIVQKPTTPQPDSPPGPQKPQKPQKSQKPEPESESKTEDEIVQKPTTPQKPEPSPVPSPVPSQFGPLKDSPKYITDDAQNLAVLEQKLQEMEEQYEETEVQRKETELQRIEALKRIEEIEQLLNKEKLENQELIQRLEGINRPDDVAPMDDDNGDEPVEDAVIDDDVVGDGVEDDVVEDAEDVVMDDEESKGDEGLKPLQSALPTAPSLPPAGRTVNSRVVTPEGYQSGDMGVQPSLKRKHSELSDSGFKQPKFTHVESAFVGVKLLPSVRENVSTHTLINWSANIIESYGEHIGVTKLRYGDRNTSHEEASSEYHELMQLLIDYEISIGAVPLWTTPTHAMNQPGGNVKGINHNAFVNANGRSLAKNVQNHNEDSEFDEDNWNRRYGNGGQSGGVKRRRLQSDVDTQCYQRHRGPAVFF